MQATGADIVEDRRIAEAIANARDRSSGSAELAAQVDDLHSARHLGTQPCNLLRPLTGLMDGPVLEVGSRFGALTRYFGEHAPHVTALERTSWRAEATASRCQGLEAVATYCEDFRSFRPRSRFRLVAFIDTLEGSAAAGMIERAGRMLAENGLVLIAASNRLRGGVTEGLRGLGEWQALLRACDMEAVAVLYPFPDHRLPTLVLTDGAFRERRLHLGSLLESCGAGGQVHWPALVENGIAAQFANSFAILARGRCATAEAGLSPSCLVYHYATARLPAFRKQTCIQEEDGRLMVRRRRLYPDLAGHDGYEHRVEDEAFIEGPLYGGLLDLLQVERWSVAAIAAWAQPWLDHLRAHSRPGAAGISELPPRFVDCVPFNLVRTPGGELRAIDDEYTCRESLPLDFVAFRGIWLALARARTSAPDEDLRQWRLAELTVAILGAAGMEISSERLRYLIDREADLQHAIVGVDRAQAATSLASIVLAAGSPATAIESQLFWRKPDESFNERASERARTLACAKPRTLRLRIPPLEPAPAELRFDIADRAGMAQLFQMRLLDDAGAVLWEWDGSVPALAAATHFETGFLGDEAPGRGAILHLDGNDPRLILPVSAERLAPLRNGGFFEAEFAWIGSL